MSNDQKIIEYSTVNHKERRRRSKAIKVWRFDEAPLRYQKLSQGAGDEDWIVFVPREYIHKHGSYINWLMHIDTVNDPEEYHVADGVIYIGGHA